MSKNSTLVSKAAKAFADEYSLFHRQVMGLPILKMGYPFTSFVNGSPSRWSVWGTIYKADAFELIAQFQLLEAFYVSLRETAPRSHLALDTEWWLTCSPLASLTTLKPYTYPKFTREV